MTQGTPRIPYPELRTSRMGISDMVTPGMSSSRLAQRVEFKTLDFEVEVMDALFNLPGRYFLKMTVQSLFTKDYSGILLCNWPDETFRRDHEALTSVVTQSGTDQEPELCLFDEKKFTFRLPEGFCKHDRNHDVYLLIEAFKLPNNGQDMGQKAGEGKVAIYPRTNAPKTNLNVNPGEDMYRHTSVISLLRTSNKPGKTEMHCGRMRCTFALKEFDKMAEERKKREEEERLRKEEEDRCAAEIAEREKKEYEDRLLQEPDPFKPGGQVARTPFPGMRESTPKPVPPPIRVYSPISEWGDTTLILPPSPSPSPPRELIKTVDAPLPENDHSTYSAQPTWRHTAGHGKEQIDVIVHGASNLPSASLGTAPQPFCSLKTDLAWESGRKAKARTHAVVRPTNAPSWEEMVTMDMSDTEAAQHFVVLSANDSNSKEELVTYRFPLSYLKPFHQYHVKMILPAKDESEGIKMYTSITRKTSALPNDPSSPNYLALEVFLRAVKHPIQNPAGPLLAVARIVPDYYNYKSDNLTNPKTAGVHMTTITFPSPPSEAFEVPQQSSYGHPQLSLIGKPENQPKWNHPYLFCDEKDKATMFTPSAALVIEYYVANTAMTEEFWKVKSPIGFSSLSLDQNVYKQLKAEKAKQGIRVDGVPIMGSDLRCSDGRPPIIGMVLKLMSTEHPDSIVAMSNLDNLPVMELKEGQAPHTPEVLHVKTPSPEPEEQEEKEEEDTLAPGLYLQRVDRRKLQLQDGEMPPYDAVENVLPEYQYIFVDPNQEQDTARGDTTRPRPGPPSRRIQPQTATGTSYTRDPNDLDQTHMSVLDQQMRDLDNYRGAVQRMGQDIMTLRTQVRSLEGENHKLRTDVNHYDDSRKLLIDAADLDRLAKPELASRYASLRQKLAQQTTEVKDYKSKVQRLQNELIKKNDKEKDYLRMTHAHASQQELLQRLQDKVMKVRKLEETCKKQEKVIEKMENVLRKLRDKGGKGNNAMNDENAALTDENSRLRQQLQDIKTQMANAGLGGGEDQEKLELYQALERAEGRIMSLEKQLSENARTWGKERADLNIRMNEAEHGFGRTGGLVLHDYPVLDTNYHRSMTVPSRIGKLR